MKHHPDALSYTLILTDLDHIDFNQLFFIDLIEYNQAKSKLFKLFFVVYEGDGGNEKN